MKRWKDGVSSRRGALRFVAAVTLLLTLLTATPTAARGDDSAYLALGDSVAFGYNPLVDPHDAANFTGYPSAVATALDLRLTNAACPGEASGGFIALTGVDNVCRPYRAAFPLHVAYTTAQLDFAVAFLRGHPHTALVSIDIGANDLFVLQKGCTAAHPGDPAAIQRCIATGLPAVLDTLTANLATIYGRIRNEGHYRGDLVALTYYATDYRDAAGVATISAANQVVARVTRRYDGAIADGFGAFQRVAAHAGGDSCAAGLLIRLSANTCDIHPSPSGRTVLARAILRALGHDDTGEHDG